MAKTKLNIFLGKSRKRIGDMIKNPEEVQRCNEIHNGEFYYKEVVDKKPKWLSSFFNDTIEDQGLRNKVIQAVYLIEVDVSDNEQRVFAITFGLGRNILKLECFEERFGITTAMNLIDEQKLRAIDSNNLDSNPKTNRIQLGRLSSIKEFDLDSEYDLLKNISGKIVTNMLSDVISASGRQSLSISVTADIENIQDLLQNIYRIYCSESYLQKFQGFNHTHEIKDKLEIERLDIKLIEHIENESNDDFNISLTIPEIVRDEDINSFSYGRGINHYDDIDFQNMVSEIRTQNNGTINIPVLKSENISIEGIDGSRRFWKIYKCLIVDCRIDNHQYILNDGKWFVFDENYAAEVNRFYNEAEISLLALPECGINTKEDVYNTLAAESVPTFVKLDRELLNPFNETTFEVCDIFDKSSNSFIHVKKKYNSASLSHLFFQGSVSGEFLNVSKVRRDLLDYKPEMEECIHENSYAPSDFTIVYAIIEKGATHERPNIPFFSKVSFRQTSLLLKNFGYNVQLKSIKWNDR